MEPMKIAMLVVVVFVSVFGGRKALFAAALAAAIGLAGSNARLHAFWGGLTDALIVLPILIGMPIMGMSKEFWHESKEEALGMATLGLLFIAMHATGGVFSSISINDAWWKMTLSGIAENNAFVAGVLPSMDKTSWPIVAMVAFGASTAGSFTQYGSLPAMVAAKDPTGGPKATLKDFLKLSHVTVGVYAIGMATLAGLAYWLK